MKTLLIVLALAASSAGCASLTGAGHAGATVTRDASGKCALALADGKEYSGRSVAFNGETCVLVVQEGESKAFKGQGIAAKAAAVFPVTDLANIISGGPAQ